jgi:hypothetical protein
MRAMRVLVPGFCAIALSAAHANGSFTRERLVGTWAVDCSQSPGPTNLYLYYSRNGDGTMTYQLVNSENRHAIPAQTLSGFQSLEGGLLRIKYVRDSDRDVTIVTLKFAGGKQWSFSAADPDGTLHISDGKFIDGGGDVPHFERCSN